MTTTPLQAPPSELDPFGDAFLADPYPGHEELREAGPVVWLARYGVYAMARFEHVDGALRDAETYCSRRGVGLTDFAREKPWRPPSLLLEADPPEHTRARRAMTAVLTPATVKGMHATFAREAGEMVAAAVEAERFDGIGELVQPFLLKVFGDAVGLPEEGRDQLLPYGAMVFNGFGPRNEHFERAMAAGAAVRDAIMAMTRRDALEPGGLGALIHAAAEAEGFEEGERELLVRSFLSAGVDTIVHGLGNALLVLAQHPDQWALVRADRGLAGAAFEEVLRYEASVQTFFRTTTRAVEVDGVELPEGAKVLLFLAAANRDPRHCERADELDVTRRGVRHVTMGAGIHVCVGRIMARLEAQTLLGALAGQVAELALDGEPVRELNNTLRGLARLPLRVTPA
jgi:4-methoxybenzoate monooxygenase (O-demethylating)